MEYKTIELSKIIADNRAQPRVQMDMFVADEYKDKMLMGAKFPPIVVFNTGDVYYLADGFHRLNAAQRAGLDKIDAEIHPGELRDAILYSVGSNSEHGIRRTNEDKENAVKKLLLDPEWSLWSDYEIARKCAVSQQYVWKLRSLTIVVSDNTARQYKDRWGNITTMRTGNIGRSASERLPEETRELIKDTALADLQESNQLKLLVDMPDYQRDAVIDMIASGETDSVIQARRAVLIEEAEKLKQDPIAPPAGKYSTIVIDPPWVMEKIIREVAPNQFAFEYPMMAVEEIAAFDVVQKCADDSCHLFLWTTQKYLPAAFDILDAWYFKYVLTMVWHKPGGFQPYNLPQYNCEFVLYARRGAPTFLETKDFFTCFAAPRRGHSVKPDEFYETIKRVCPGPRIEIFARSGRDGFDAWGNEA